MPHQRTPNVFPGFVGTSANAPAARIVVGPHLGNQRTVFEFRQRSDLHFFALLAFLFAQRALIAFRASALRSSRVMASMRAFPPRLPACFTSIP